MRVRKCALLVGNEFLHHKTKFEKAPPLGDQDKRRAFAVDELAKDAVCVVRGVDHVLYEVGLLATA